MSKAPPSLTAPFSGLTLVWVVLLSSRFTGEVPSLWQKVAAGLIVVGEVTVTLSGDHSVTSPITLSTFPSIYSSPSLLSYLLSTLLLLLLLLSTPHLSSSPHLRKLALGFSPGLLSGLLLFSKDALTLTAEGSLWTWQCWLLIAMAAVAGLGGLALLSRCMRVHDATYSSGMYVGSFSELGGEMRRGGKLHSCTRGSSILPPFVL